MRHGFDDVFSYLEHHRLPMRTVGYRPDEHWFSHAGWYYQCGIA